MGLYNRVTGSGNQTQLKGSQSAKPKPFNPIELEQAFNGEAIGLMEDPR